MPGTPPLGFEPSPFPVSRRLLLAGLAGGLAGPALAQAEPLIRRGTPQLTLGPFYPLHRPREEDWDLTRIAGRPGRAQGIIIDVAGRITDESGRPIARAKIDTWQTNALGAYHHPSDESGLPKDPNFQGAAVFQADADGYYRMRTVMPMPYATRQRHIHFDIRGRNRRLMTQMFFPGEPNESDQLFASLRSAPLQAAVTATRADKAGSEGITSYVWNVALAGE
jgi:protocatechuate 3,4-dioxygenase, beta subunit